MGGASDDEGELWIKSAGMMRGYLNLKDATADKLDDGWYRTGDLFHRDEDGFERAEEELVAAAAIEPNAYVLSALADVMEDTGRAQEASRLRRQAIDIDSSPGIDEE